MATKLAKHESDKQMIITDMGIGRTLARPAPLQTRAFVGTRGYAAPEQENRLLTDHRVDLYSVGVILHEMLTGERGAWNHNIFRGTPVIAQVLQKLLALAPAARFPTAFASVIHIDSLGITTR